MTSISATAAEESAPIGAPAWMGAAMKVGGGIFVIALLLVLWMTRDLSTRLEANTAQSAATQHAIEQHAGDAKADQAISLALLRAICYGVNEPKTARALCEVGR